MGASLQIGMHHIDQLVRGVRIECARILLRVDEVGADVVLDDLSHQAGNAAADASDHMHDALAFHLVGEGALDCFNLAADASNAGQQLLFLFDRMRHGLKL